MMSKGALGGCKFAGNDPNEEFRIVARLKLGLTRLHLRYNLGAFDIQLVRHLAAYSESLRFTPAGSRSDSTSSAANTLPGPSLSKERVEDISRRSENADGSRFLNDEHLQLQLRDGGAETLQQCQVDREFRKR